MSKYMSYIFCWVSILIGQVVAGFIVGEWTIALAFIIASFFSLTCHALLFAKD